MHTPLTRYVTLLVTYLRPQWRRSLLMLLVLLISIGLQLVNPQILSFFINTAVTGGTTTVLLMAALLFIGIALLNQAIAVATSYLSEYIAWTAQA